MNTLLVVAAAIINHNKEVLLAERPENKMLAGKLEFPGGKVEPGESPEQALIRELHEELGITVEETALTPFTFLSHPYPEHGFHLLMPVYLCYAWQGKPVALEHASLCWTRPADMPCLSMIEADSALVELLQRYL